MPSAERSAGMSLKKICSCRFLVPVETRTRSRLRIAGTRYARVLPVPVPASASRTPPRSKTRATAVAMAICPARGSNCGMARASGPCGAKTRRTASTRGVAARGWAGGGTVGQCTAAQARFSVQRAIRRSADAFALRQIMVTLGSRLRVTAAPQRILVARRRQPSGPALFGIQRELPTQRLDLRAYHAERAIVIRCLQRAREEIGDHVHLRFAHPARRDGG